MCKIVKFGISKSSLFQFWLLDVVANNITMVTTKLVISRLDKIISEGNQEYLMAKIN